MNTFHRSLKFLKKKMMMLTQQKQSVWCDWNKPSSEVLNDKNPHLWLPPFHGFLPLNFFLRCTVCADWMGSDQDVVIGSRFDNVCTCVIAHPCFIVNIVSLGTFLETGKQVLSSLLNRSVS